MKHINKKAFTLAEVMIVLVVIGILSAIIMPAAKHLMPNQEAMKFKNGNNAIYVAFRTLISSDQYFYEGDLGVRADQTLIDGTHEGDYTYLCQNLADIMSAKTIDCLGDSTFSADGHYDLNQSSSYLDTFCKNATNPRAKIITPSGITFYETNSKIPFGMLSKDYWVNTGETYCAGAAPNYYQCSDKGRLFSGPKAEEIAHSDANAN